MKNIKHSPKNALIVSVEMEERKDTVMGKPNQERKRRCQEWISSKIQYLLRMHIWKSVCEGD